MSVEAVLGVTHTVTATVTGAGRCLHFPLRLVFSLVLSFLMNQAPVVCRALPLADTQQTAREKMSTGANSNYENVCRLTGVQCTRLQE